MNGCPSISRAFLGLLLLAWTSPKLDLQFSSLLSFLGNPPAPSLAALLFPWLGYSTYLIALRSLGHLPAPPLTYLMAEAVLFLLVFSEPGCVLSTGSSWEVLAELLYTYTYTCMHGCSVCAKKIPWPEYNGVN